MSEHEDDDKRNLNGVLDDTLQTSKKMDDLTEDQREKACSEVAQKMIQAGEEAEYGKALGLHVSGVYLSPDLEIEGFTSANVSKDGIHINVAVAVASLFEESFDSFEAFARLLGEMSPAALIALSVKAEELRQHLDLPDEINE